MLAAPPACEPTFKDFAIPATVGGLASGIAGWAARQAMPNASNRRKEAATIVASTMAFWLVGGITWMIQSRRRER
jgi:hypothetical protein